MKQPPGWRFLLFLGRCRTQDLSLGEDLQRQRGREHMWREARRPDCINPGCVWRYIKTYLHPIPRSPENKTWIIYSRVQGSLSVAPWVSPSLASYFFLFISVTRYKARDNSITGQFIFLKIVWKFEVFLSTTKHTWKLQSMNWWQAEMSS